MQSGLVVVLIKDKYELHKIIDYQRNQIKDMEEQLKIFQIIEDFQIGFSQQEKVQLADAIFRECSRYRYDPLLIMAVILTESSFKKGQVSVAGARGVMQVMPHIGRHLAAESGIAWQGEDPLFDPVTNIRLGTLYLFKQIIQFRDVRKGIMAYNLGEGRLRGRLRQNEPLPRQYFHSVWENYHMLKDRYES